MPMDLLIDPKSDTRPPQPAAEPCRRKLSFDDVQRMAEAGILHADERIELIDGEILTMAAKGNFHELVRDELNIFLVENRPAGIRASTEAPLHLSATQVPEPDHMLYPADLRIPGLDGSKVHLVIEVADTTLGPDLGIKSCLYASHGVVEYWVIDAKRLVTHVHREPVGEAYASLVIVPQEGQLSPQRVPTLAFSLAQFGFDWA
jgi:Uma2 family endonuclease